MGDVMIKDKLKEEKLFYIKGFILPLIVAMAIFLPMLIVDNGYMTYIADYNMQQIPFMTRCVELVREGNFGIDWQIDIGLDVVASYSYYGLGSPFFWLLCLFPSNMTVYVMPYVYILKFVVSSFTAMMYFKRYVQNKDFAIIGGLLYAFSSLSFYTALFYSFQDAYALFPLLLIALDKLVYEDKKGFLCVAIAINALNNYFFFINECVFLVFYFIIRYICDKTHRIKISKMGVIAIECIIGVLIASVLFIPSIYSMLQSDRATNNSWDLTSIYSYFNIESFIYKFDSLLFPGDILTVPKFFGFESYLNVATYLPFVSIVGVIDYIRKNKKNWLSILSIVCIILLFIPVLNSVFMLFNVTQYSRWLYMLICILSLISVKTFESRNINISSFYITFGLMLISTISVCLGTILIQENRTVLAYNAILYTILGYVSIFISYKVYKTSKENKDNTLKYSRKVLSGVIISSIIMGISVLHCAKIMQNMNIQDIIADEAYELVEEEQTYRTLVLDESAGNFSMLHNFKSSDSFITNKNNNLIQFHNLVGYSNVVNNNLEDYPAAVTLLGSKYILLGKQNTLPVNLTRTIEQYTNCKVLKQTENYIILENEYILPMGYAYDMYIPYSDILYTLKHNDYKLLQAVVLDEETAIKYKDLLTKIDIPEDSASFDLFKKHYEKRLEGGIDTWEWKKDKFIATTSYNEEKFVVFTIPYSEWWSVTIKGEKVGIDKANNGLMCLRVPSGEQIIEFTYHNKINDIGLYVTIIGIVLFILYITIVNRVTKRDINNTKAA